MDKVNQKDKEPVMPIIRKLATGESHSYPVERMNVIKAVVCQVATMEGKKFTTKLERPVIKVTRIL